VKVFLSKLRLIPGFAQSLKRGYRVFAWESPTLEI
jgi:hypothetical protein